jgi:FimV-like protein
MLPIRPAFAVLLTLFSLFAHAAEVSPPPSQPGGNTASPQESPSALAQLQTAGNQLQATLGLLQKQSNQLQANLSALNKQIEQSPLKLSSSSTEKIAHLQALHAEYQQAQDTLFALRQQEALLQAHMAILSQKLLQLPTTKTEPPLPVATPPSTQAAPALLPAAVNSIATTLPAQTQTKPAPPPQAAKTPAPPHLQKPPALQKTDLSWLQDPALMVRIGGGFIALALLLMLFLFLPKSAQKKAPRISPESLSPKQEPSSYVAISTPEENADLTSEYDFMSTQEAIPTRLNLAKGYLEMGKLLEAREAIKPVLEHGNALQKQEAQILLEEIENVEMHV